MAKKVVTEKSLLEIINDNLTILNDEYDVEDEKSKKVAFESVLCKFYNGQVNCIGCPKSIDRLEQCAEEYKENIGHRPMLVYHPDFTLDVVREVGIQNNIARLSCSSCYFSQKCPHFVARHTCAINWGGDLHTMDPKDQINVLIRLQEERINIARTAELVDGGIPDQNLSNEMDRLTGLINMKSNLNANRINFSMTATGGEATSSGGGLLAKLFGAKQQDSLPSPTSIPLPQPEFQEADVVSAKKTSKK